MSAVPPIHREVLVDADPATAFTVFTAHIGRWWPLADLSVHGAGATVAFEDGEIVERSPAGERAVWGRVTRWDPGEVVAFSWHPGRPSERASHVTVTFHAMEARTRVALEHSGWEAYDDPSASRAEYGNGWPTVLDLYGADVAHHRSSELTWVALVHRPGPGIADGASVFADPRFPDHLAFLSRMRERGYLVAAGPLLDTVGEGMAILRLPGGERLADATRLATEEDASVVGGLFTVTVRPWQVMLST